MGRQQTLIDLLQQAHDEEIRFYESLTAEDKARQGKADDWSAKDLLAHCAYWKQFRVPDIQEVLKGGTVRQFDDFDHENASVFEEFKDKSWDEVLAFSDHAAAVLTAQLQSMSDSDLELAWHDERPMWRAIVGNAFSHPLVHISQHYQQKGDMQRAAAVTSLMAQPLAALDDSPDWQGVVHYNTACAYALIGKKEEAIAELALALPLTPFLVEWSQEDPDLQSLHDDPAYQALYS